MTQTDDAPKPCPFCEGDVGITDATRVLGVWRLLHRCKVIGPISLENYKREALIAAWNRRAGLAPTPQDARLAALRSALEWIALRNHPDLPPSVLLDAQYIKDSHVREMAHDMLGMARAALAAFDKGGKADE